MSNKRCSQHLPSYRSSNQAPALGIATSQRELGQQGLLQPPPGADPQLWQWFCAVDTDGSGTITVPELQSALSNGNWTSEVLSHFLVVFDLSSGQGFDLDTVKMLMSIFDTDRNGTISFSEFGKLWKYILDWQDVFRNFDRDQSGSIEGHELSEALRSFGYSLSSPLLTSIEKKYASGPTSYYGPPPGITFDRFMRACVLIRTVTKAFLDYDSDRDGWIQLNYEQFLTIVLNAP